VTTVTCGPGTENLNGQCVVSCAEDERREGARCVAVCSEGESMVDGQCRTEGAIFIKRVGDFADELCACGGDQACADPLVAKRESLKPPAAMTDNQLAALEGLGRRVDGCLPNSKVVQEFALIKDEMCACEDKDCAEAVNKKFEEWLTANEKAKGSKGQQERAKDIAEDYTKCMMTAMAGQGGE
jgi:hypothetical protein